MGARWLCRTAVPVALAAAAGGCAGKGSWDETRDVYVVSLPHGAAVTWQGRAAGTTPVSLALPSGAGETGLLPVRLERPGFRPETRLVSPDAPPDRLVVVLIPDLPEAPAAAPAPDDAEGYYRLGKLLVDARRCRDALAYLDRTLELAPRHARAHRDRGGCLLDLGEASLAIEHLARYLLLVPDAPDAAQIQAQLDLLREPKDIDLDPPARAE